MHDGLDSIIVVNIYRAIGPMQDIKSQPRMRILTFLQQCVKELYDQFGGKFNPFERVFLSKMAGSGVCIACVLSQFKRSWICDLKQVCKGSIKEKRGGELAPPLFCPHPISGRNLSPAKAKQAGFNLRHAAAVFLFAEADHPIVGDSFDRKPETLQFLDQHFKGSRDTRLFNRLAFDN